MSSKEAHRLGEKKEMPREIAEMQREIIRNRYRNVKLERKSQARMKIIEKASAEINKYDMYQGSLQ